MRSGKSGRRWMHMWLEQALECEGDGNGPWMLIFFFFSASFSTGHVCICGVLHHAQPAVLANKSQLHCRDERPWWPRLIRPGRRSHRWHQQINTESHQRHGGGKVAQLNKHISVLEEREFIFNIEAFWRFSFRTQLNIVEFTFWMWFKQTWTFSSFTLLLLSHTPWSRNMLQMILNIK